MIGVDKDSNSSEVLGDTDRYSKILDSTGVLGEDEESNSTGLLGEVSDSFSM